MPPLYEGTLFYMPVTAPAASISVATELLRLQDKILKGIPEVESVFGKAGRAETATDPAPLEMFETVMNLKPESRWRPGMTVEKLKDEMNDALTIPGVSNSFTMPIKARLDMLATGIRTPVGIKILGPNLEEMEKIGLLIEQRLKSIPGTRSVYAERVTTGYFLDISVRREEAARYGLSVQDVQEVIESAIGGMNLTTTIEGRERYPVNVRYARELRGEHRSAEEGARACRGHGAAAQASPGGGMAAAGGSAAAIRHRPLPNRAACPSPSLRTSRSCAARRTSRARRVFSRSTSTSISPDATWEGTSNEAKKSVASLKIPEGYRLEWSGEYEYLVKTHERLKLVIPLTFLVIFVLIYFNTKSVTKTIIVLLAVPFSLVGSFWFLYLLGYNMSIAVWVGIIALAGLDAETGVVMLLYLELAHAEWELKGKLKSLADLKDAVMHGAVKRIRPKIMTVGVILAGLIPVMFSHGAGSDIMKRIAAPMVGGVVTSTILELVIYPAIYMLWKGRQFK